MTETRNCEYANPIDFEGEVPTLPTHHFYFQDIECDIEIEGAATTSETGVGFNPTSTISSSTDITVYGYFSAGEILIAFLLVLLIFLQLLGFLIKSLGAINTKKRYIEYSNGDVPINEQL